MLLRNRIESFKSLKPFSTLGVGGKAEQLVCVYTIEEMQDVYKYISSKNVPFVVIGKGSNLLFDDRGFLGLVIVNKIDFITFDAGNLEVGAGTSFSFLGIKMSKKGWGGLQFASGIPGSVGGAIYMNAGANGMQTSDCLVAVKFIDSKGECIEEPKEAFAFDYRTSSFQRERERIIVSGTFKLKKDANAQKAQFNMIRERTAKQPYAEKSAGCFFRNPEGESAGFLIEACGLKGERKGEAQVSTLHANFIINRGKATAQDVLDLAKIVKKRVKEKMGTTLKMEVQTIPYCLSEHAFSPF